MPKDPQRAAKLRARRALLHGLPEDETAVFMDEVEVHTNPKVGCMGMGRGEQAAVPTPGWWRLHEAVTRNHRCATMEELLALTFAWLDERRYFHVRSKIYAQKPHKGDALPQLRGAI